MIKALIAQTLTAAIAFPQTVMVFFPMMAKMAQTLIAVIAIHQTVTKMVSLAITTAMAQILLKAAIFNK